MPRLGGRGSEGVHIVDGLHPALVWIDEPL